MELSYTLGSKLLINRYGEKRITLVTPKKDTVQYRIKSYPKRNYIQESCLEEGFNEEDVKKIGNIRK